MELKTISKILRFTLQYVAIYTKKIGNLINTTKEFTLQYVAIYTKQERLMGLLQNYLHYSMLLFTLIDF